MQDLYFIYTIGHLLAETFPEYNLSILDRNSVQSSISLNYIDNKYKRYVLCITFMFSLMGCILINDVDNNLPFIGSSYYAALLPLSMLLGILNGGFKNEFTLTMYYITIAIIFWLMSYNVKYYKWISMIGVFIIYGLMLLLIDAMNNSYYDNIDKYKMGLNVTICMLVFMKSLDLATKSTNFWRGFAVSFIYVGIVALNFYKKEC